MFLTYTMIVAAGLLALLPGARALPGEPFLRYDPVLYTINPEAEARSDEPFEELGVDFIKMPDNAEKGYKLYKFIKGLQRRRELHQKSSRFPYRPLLNTGFVDLWVDRIPAPELPTKQTLVGNEIDTQKTVPEEPKKDEVKQETLQVKNEPDANCTKPKLFFNFLFTFNKNIHYIFFFVIEHDNNILANMYYLES